MQEIFDVMEERGIRQQWLADRLGLHKSLLSKYKSGERVAPPDVVLRAAALLDLRVSVVVATPVDIPATRVRRRAAL